MKKTLYSPRLDREFELEVCTPCADQIVGDGSDITIVRAISLEKILYSLAGAVNFQWKEIGNGAIIVDLYDDSGVHVVGVGDAAPKGLKNDIARSYPEATAWSRAISAAVVRYLGFEGRVYTDASFEVENSYSETPVVKAEVPVSTAETVEESAADPLAAATTVAVNESESVPFDPREVVYTSGTVKGKKLGEIIESDDKNLFKYTQKKPGIPLGRSYLEYVYSKNLIKDPNVREAIEMLLNE